MSSTNGWKFGAKMHGLKRSSFFSLWLVFRSFVGKFLSRKEHGVIYWLLKCRSKRTRERTRRRSVQCENEIFPNGYRTKNSREMYARVWGGEMERKCALKIGTTKANREYLSWVSPELPLCNKLQLMTQGFQAWIASFRQISRFVNVGKLEEYMVLVDCGFDMRMNKCEQYYLWEYRLEYRWIPIDNMNVHRIFPYSSKKLFLLLSGKLF